MAYNIGQLRRSEISSYDEDIIYEQGLIDTENSILTFKNQYLLLKGSNIVNSLYTYYLKFRVKQRTDLPQNFTLTLQSSEVTSDNTEELRTYNVKQGLDGYTTFELIFSPNATYNEIIFDLRRESLDFYTTTIIDTGESVSGRIMEIEIVEFKRLTNVITSYLAKNFSGLTELKKIGIQGPPGLLFTINGEEIQIGRSGIYELYNNDIIITYIGFVIKDSLYTQDGKDYFIMDFKY
jgi:hypothetical protein